jgi:hypothetical protein
MLHWSKPDGELAEGMALHPQMGNSVSQRTYEGHVWKVLRSGGPDTPLRTVVIENKFGVVQTIDVATGDVRSDGDHPAPTSGSTAGTQELGGDVVGLWRNVQQRTEEHARYFTAASSTCSVPSVWHASDGGSPAELSGALRLDAGSPITMRCADGDVGLEPEQSLVGHLASVGCADAADWLSRSGLVRGYHVICAQQKSLPAELRAAAAGAQRNGLIVTIANVFTKHTAEDEQRGENADGLELTVVPGGSASESVARSALLSLSGMDMKGLRVRLEQLGFVYKTDDALRSWDDMWTPQQWRLFNTDGMPVEGVDEVARGGLFLLYEGGQFVWPGVEKGFKRQVQIYDRSLTIETLELKPLILSVDGFLSSEEVDRVVEVAGPRVKPSGVTMNDADRKAGKKNSDFRTSVRITRCQKATDQLTRSGSHASVLVSIPHACRVQRIETETILAAQ